MPVPHPHGVETRNAVLAAARRVREHRERIAATVEQARDAHEQARRQGDFWQRETIEQEDSE